MKKNKNGWYYEERWQRLVHYVNSSFHNEKSPAFIWKEGTRCWSQNNEFHRLDGPAIEYTNGYKEWYCQDKYIHCSSQKDFERIIKLRLLW